MSCTLGFVNNRSSAHLQVNILFAEIGRSEGRRRLMWRSTSKPLFILPPLPPFFLFLSVSPSFSFAMQPEKAVSSEEKTKKRKKKKKEGSKRGNGGMEGERRRGGNGSRMVMCEEVLMTSLPLTALRLLSVCHLQYEIHHCRILPTKRVALCLTKR